MDSLVFQLATNGIYLLGFLLVLLVFFHIALIRVAKLGKIGWKWTEYVWLGFAALGLVTLTGDVRTWVSENHLQNQTASTLFAFDRLTSALQSAARGACRKFTPSEFPSDNLDEIQTEHDDVCDWFKKLEASLPKTVEPDFPALDFSTMPPPDGIRDAILQDLVSWIEHLYDDYNDRRRKRNEFLAKSTKTYGEDELYFFSPIFLCIALAIRFTKVSGELKLEKT